MVQRDNRRFMFILLRSFRRWRSLRFGNSLWVDLLQHLMDDLPYSEAIDFCHAVPSDSQYVHEVPIDTQSFRALMSPIMQAFH